MAVPCRSRRSSSGLRRGSGMAQLPCSGPESPEDAGAPEDTEETEDAPAPVAARARGPWGEAAAGAAASAVGTSAPAAAAPNPRTRLRRIGALPEPVGVRW
ncbi:hypothetical protein GCM10009863_28210 [Streptomyces axinellae]|uniref:Uncharacterized protein n=1 Tax=Streptomyces axinellae TaxID=552788 RepID=A0ABP6CCB5_9ACTN